MPKVGAKTDKTMTAVGAYIFAGGFTVGVRAAGFDVLCHLEGSDYGVPTARLNFPSLPIHVGVESWPVDELADGPEIDFVYGNPPCAAWSGNNPASHKQDAWRTDPRVSCTREHFKLLTALRPKVWAWESVTQAATKGRELVDELTAEAIANGYSVTELFHDAMRMGAPQTRKRWFMVAHRIELDFPAEKLLPEISAVDALAKVKPVGPPAYDSGTNESFLPYLHRLKPGGRLRNLWDELNPESTHEVKDNGHIKGRVGFGHCRLRDSGPASATVGYSMVHPTEDRFLTVNEVQAIASFPQTFKFIGNKNGAQQLDLIARGVCPSVGRWLATRVAEAIERDVAVTEPTTRVVNLINAGRVVTTVAKVTNAVKTDVTKNKAKGKLGHPGSKPQDLDRQYDTTQLKDSQHGQYVHRDYAAHFFRWGWASRFVKPGTRVMDVGCGQELPLVKILCASLSTVPAAYVGVDLNRVTKRSKISWVEAIHDEFDFPGGGWKTIKKGHAQFDLVSCFEVIEHMHEESGRKLLTGMRECLADDGTILLSTPVYDGKKMAANHLREYTIDELSELIDSAGLEVVERFGTFASWNAIRKVCTKTERDLLDQTGRFYGGDVLACFLAPKYPDASRNNAWVLKRKS